MVMRKDMVSENIWNSITEQFKDVELAVTAVFKYLEKGLD